MNANREIVLNMIDEATESMDPAEAHALLEELHADIQGRMDALADAIPEPE
jgi:ABC-type transport system involved in cytochrome bd biosynthesis fused ATPase/permease subunit